MLKELFYVHPQTKVVPKFLSRRAKGNPAIGPWAETGGTCDEALLAYEAHHCSLERASEIKNVAEYSNQFSINSTCN